jgi:glycosyltransferase involved in cell wall biosynthesis
MRLTVAICTWNRCDLLRQCLEQMTQLVIPEGVDWELLVVNNNCTDATNDVIKSFHDRLPIRGLFEPRPGKSNALNLAVNEAKGDYIIWTDDDVLVDERWVAAYHEAFNLHPEAVVFGGTIEPWFEGDPPPWLVQTLSQVGTVYGIRKIATPIPLSDELVPYGANMAVRREEQVRHLYDASLGPRPNAALRGEETFLVRQLLANGLHGWWVPGARVRHFISKQQQTAGYLRKYFFGQGEFEGLQMPLDGPELFGKPRYLWRELLTGELMLRVHRLFGQNEGWINHLIKASMARGGMSAYARRRA